MRGTGLGKHHRPRGCNARPKPAHRFIPIGNVMRALEGQNGIRDDAARIGRFSTSATTRCGRFSPIRCMPISRYVRQMSMPIGFYTGSVQPLGGPCIAATAVERNSPVLSSRSGTAAPKSLIRYRVNSVLCGLNGDEYPGEKKLGSSTFVLIPISARLYDAPHRGQTNLQQVGRPSMHRPDRTEGTCACSSRNSIHRDRDRAGDRAVAPAGSQRRETIVRRTGRSAARARPQRHSPAQQGRDRRISLEKGADARPA